MEARREKPTGGAESAPPLDTNRVKPSGLDVLHPNELNNLLLDTIVYGHKLDQKQEMTTINTDLVFF